MNELQPSPTDAADDRVDEDERLVWARLQLDPTLLLPVHLQGISFSNDIWRRMREHSFKGTGIKARIQQDAEIRDLLNIAILAALDREKDVLLYHQARVFQHLLWRSFEGLRSFMNLSLLPPSWLASPKAALPSLVPSSVVANGPVVPPTPTTPSDPPWWKEWLATLLTPKGLLVVATFFFACVTGYSYVQIETYKDTIAAYKQASEANESTMKSFTNEKTLQAESLRKKDEALAKAQKEVVDAEARYLDTKGKLDAKTGVADLLERRLKELDQEKQNLEAKQTNLDKKILDERNSLQKELGVIRQQLATESANAKNKDEQLQAEKKRLEANNKTLSELQAQLKAFQDKSGKVWEENLQLQKKASLLLFADVFVGRMRQAASYRSVDPFTISRALEEFDTARNAILKPSGP
jgi:hypothetical protein